MGENFKIVETGCGKIKGIERTGSFLFRGVPFCTAGRFEKPVPVEDFAPFAGSDGILDACGPEYACPQLRGFRDESLDPSFYYHEFREKVPQETVFDEHTMRMNIVVPREILTVAANEPGEKFCSDSDASSHGPLPVLVFIHGGGFETGHPGEIPFGDTEEYAKRGIVFVSLGYRLNVFALYESGNYGLHDLITGIEWVHRHIADFGGDPSRITIVGQSAGAMNITDLLLTKRLKGLIQGAVCMSGGGALPKFAKAITASEAEAFWKKVREGAGCRSEEEARSVSAEKLWSSWYETVRHSKLTTLSTKCPGLDGEIIPDIAQNQEKKRLDLDVPLIFGVTSQDFMPIIVYELALRRGLRAEKIKYPPFYGYFFDRALPGNDYKAFHACDLWYMFGNMEQSFRPFEAVDCALAAKMMDYLANFVRTGNPNGASLPEWKPVGRKQKGFMRFDTDRDGYAYPAECRYKTLKTMLWDHGPM